MIAEVKWTVEGAAAANTRCLPPPHSAQACGGGDAGPDVLISSKSLRFSDFPEHLER